jgi:3-hydroxybutyryl-CoA dehydrogenase
MSIDRVLVAGAGLMGHGIAESLALAGRQVTLYEPELARATAGRDRIGAGLERRVGRGAMTPDERAATLERIAATDGLAAAAAVDLVIEAVFEDVEVKSRLWADLDRRARPEAIFATNTSSISIVEMIRGSATSDATVGAVRELSAAMGKQVIVSADRPGFIVNRMLMPFLGEAMRAFEQGLGTAEDIDTGARIGLNHPMGPLELADFIGLDVCLGVMEVLYDGFGQEQFAPPAVLRSLVEAGNLGRKTGRGFHVYPPAEGAPAS